MKNIFKYLPLIAVIALASCAKEAPSKSSVESGFDKFTGTLPTVAISRNVDCNAIEGYATVLVTYSGITTSLDSLSVGVLSDTDPTFRTASFTKYESAADGTVSLKAKVSPNKTFYIRGVVACTAGTSYSDVIEVKVPDIPFYLKVPGQYAATVTSAANGAEYNNTLTVVANSSDPENKCYIFGIEPYWFGEGYGSDVTKALNVCEATIDSETKTLTIENQSSIHLGSRVIMGVDAPDLASAQYYSDIVFKMTDDDNGLYRANAFVTVVVSESGEGENEDAYLGNVTYVIK